MKKIAVFVEGLTEQLLVTRLVAGMAGRRKFEVEIAEQYAGKVTIRGSLPDPQTEIFVLVANCQNDEQVKTQVRDQYPTLVAAGYAEIIGLRDVYPMDRSKIPQIRLHLMTGVRTNPIHPRMHLAVMETEAWFIGESTHFEKIHEELTTAYIATQGIGLGTTNADDWDEPAALLDRIYKLKTSGYLIRGKKTRRRIERTLNAVSVDELYVTCAALLPDLADFLNSLESAILNP